MGEGGFNAKQTSQFPTDLPELSATLGKLQNLCSAAGYFALNH